MTAEEMISEHGAVEIDSTHENPGVRMWEFADSVDAFRAVRELHDSGYTASLIFCTLILFPESP